MIKLGKFGLTELLFLQSILSNQLMQPQEVLKTQTDNFTNLKFDYYQQA